jgi:hypothetical protein
MADDDAMLGASLLYSTEEVLAEFQECCEADAQTPGHYSERLKRAAEDLFEMLDRQNSSVQAKKK